MTPRKTLTVGNGGWCRFEQVTTPWAADHLLVYVRFALSDRGRFEIAEMYFPPQRGASSATRRARAFPATAVEAWANEAGFRVEIEQSLSRSGPLLSTAASHYRRADEQISSDPDWVDQMLDSQRPGSTFRRATEVPYVYVGDVDPWPDAPSLKLEVPPEGTKPYPPEFFVAVARVYLQASRSYPNPSPRIADANGVPVTTVRRWVKRARQLELLTAGHHGRRG